MMIESVVTHSYLLICYYKQKVFQGTNRKGRWMDWWLICLTSSLSYHFVIQHRLKRPISRMKHGCVKWSVSNIKHICKFTDRIFTNV